VQFLDAAAAVISTLYDSTTEEIVTLDTWEERSVVAFAVPVNTRFIKTTLTANKISGGIADACFDEIVFSVTEIATTNTHHAVYEDVIYEVTTAGVTDASEPTYDTVIDAETTDGTAVMTAREAWNRAGAVSEYVDNANIGISVTDARATDGWFNGGAIFIESGINQGQAREIRSWIAATGDLSLFVPFPFKISPGTLVRLYPGCDKSFPLCISRFANAVNFRGKPFIPGDDSVDIAVQNSTGGQE